jgi:deazaflavin-dependent oxidoreductase (nitroreductase family)
MADYTMYRKPGLVTRTMNRFVSWLASRGLMPSDTITLEVRGRRSGQMRSAVINWVEHEGQRYFVSPRGEAEWVRNVRAADGEAVIRRRERQKVRLEEVPAEQRAPIIKAYLAKTEVATRQHFGVDPKTEIGEFEAIAARHPVFRIVKVD